MENKRNLKRRHLIYYLRVFDQKTKKPIGHLVDVTPEGIMVISEQPIITDIVFQLELILPVAYLGIEKLEFVARSVWCRQDVNPDFYDTGFQLLEVSREHFSVVETLIDEFGFRD